MASSSSTAPQSSPGSERRKLTRVPLVVQVESRADASSSIGRTENVSEGGLLVNSRDTFSPGTEVIVRFNLPPVPPGRPMECTGVVLRAECGARMAIEFRQLNDEDRQALQTYVHEAGDD